MATVRDVQPMNPEEANRRMRMLSSRLLDLIDEHAKVTEELAAAKAEYHRIFHHAHISSVAEYGKQRNADAHKSHAEVAASDAYRSMVMLEERDKAMRNEMHSLRQVLSSLQSTVRTMGNVT